MRIGGILLFDLFSPPLACSMKMRIGCAGSGCWIESVSRSDGGQDGKRVLEGRVFGEVCACAGGSVVCTVVFDLRLRR